MPVRNSTLKSPTPSRQRISRFCAWHMLVARKKNKKIARPNFTGDRKSLNTNSINFAKVRRGRTQRGTVSRAPSSALLMISFIASHAFGCGSHKSYGSRDTGPARLELQQFDERAAKNSLFLSVAEERCVQHQIYIGMPIERHVSSKDHLAYSLFRYEMAQSLIRNNDRVHKNLALQIFAGMFFIQAIGIGPHLARDFCAPEVGWQVAA